MSTEKFDRKCNVMVNQFPVFEKERKRQKSVEPNQRFAIRPAHPSAGFTGRTATYFHRTHSYTMVTGALVAFHPTRNANPQMYRHPGNQETQESGANAPATGIKLTRHPCQSQMRLRQNSKWKTRIVDSLSPIGSSMCRPTFL